MKVTEAAERAYYAYGEHSNWRNFRGDPMPPWNNIGDEVQGHWIAAVKAVLADVESALGDTIT